MDMGGSAAASMKTAQWFTDPPKGHCLILLGLAYQFAGFFSVTAVTGYQTVFSLKPDGGQLLETAGGFKSPKTYCNLAISFTPLTPTSRLKLASIAPSR